MDKPKQTRRWPWSKPRLYFYLYDRNHMNWAAYVRDCPYSPQEVRRRMQHHLLTKLNAQMTADIDSIRLQWSRAEGGEKDRLYDLILKKTSEMNSRDVIKPYLILCSSVPFSLIQNGVKVMKFTQSDIDKMYALYGFKPGVEPLQPHELLEYSNATL